MPLKDTPWGSMRQARSAQHTSGNVPRPPRPSYLPPTPPKCSVSPLPSTVSSIGKSEITSVVYDDTSQQQKNNSIKNGIHNNTPARFAHLRPSLPPPTLTPDRVSSIRVESNNNSSTNNHDTTSEESDSEDLDEYEDEDDDEEYDYEEELELKLENNGKILDNSHSTTSFTTETDVDESEAASTVVSITLPSKIQEVTSTTEDDDSETETEESSYTDSETESSSEFQANSVNIVEVTDIKECEGLQTVTEYSISEADAEDEDGNEIPEVTDYQVELEDDEQVEQGDVVAADEKDNAGNETFVEVVDNNKHQDVDDWKTAKGSYDSNKGDNIDKADQLSDVAVVEDDGNNEEDWEWESEEEEEEETNPKENDKEQDCHNVNDAAEIEILEVEEEGGQESICTNDVCSPRSSSSTSTKLLDNNQQESDKNAWPNDIEEAVMEPNGISDIKIIDDKNNLPPSASSPLPASKSEIDIKREMLKMMPTPKIPPFVKSDPPCDFQDDPTTWIEWLEEEVLKFKEEQIMKKKKAEQQKSLEEERNKLEEERNKLDEEKTKLAQLLQKENENGDEELKINAPQEAKETSLTSDVEMNDDNEEKLKVKNTDDDDAIPIIDEENPKQNQDAQDNSDAEIIKEKEGVNNINENNGEEEENEDDWEYWEEEELAEEKVVLPSSEIICANHETSSISAEENNQIQANDEGLSEVESSSVSYGGYRSPPPDYVNLGKVDLQQKEELTMAKNLRFATHGIHAQRVLYKNGNNNKQNHPTSDDTAGVVGEIVLETLKKSDEQFLESSNEIATKESTTTTTSGMNNSDDKKVVEVERQHQKDKGQVEEVVGVDDGQETEVNEINDDEEKDTISSLEKKISTSSTTPASEKTTTEKIPRKHSDPMEVIEKMRQMRQNRVLHRQLSADGSSTASVSASGSGQGGNNGNLGAPPPFMRTQSNPAGSGDHLGPRNRSRPSSIVSNQDDNLDDMLGRVRKLRDERNQILKDMAMLKDAMSEETPENDNNPETGNNTESDPNNPDRGRLSSFDSGIGPSKSVTTEGSTTQETRKVSHQSSINNENKNSNNSDLIYCFICDEELGNKLNKGAIMHMGLEDGEPICPEALNLTEKSKQKVRNIALTTHLDLKAKYEFLETLDLDLITGEEYDMTTVDALQKIQDFLNDIEEQKKRDAEQFDLLRAGAIDEIFAAEFAAENSEENDWTENEPSIAEYDLDTADEISDAIASASINNAFAPTTTHSSSRISPQSSPMSTPSTTTTIGPPPPPPPPAPPLAPPPPPPSLTDPHLKEARSDLLNAIKTGVPKLKKSSQGTNDKSQPSDVGKVLHKHLAPRVFTREVRNLMKEIQNPNLKPALKKTKTNDRSRPYIPEDIEIYFYAGPNANKSLAPPPLSREIQNKTRTPTPPPSSALTLSG